MTIRNQDAPLMVPPDLRVSLLAELDLLCGQISQTLCRRDVESGTLAECTPQERVLRQLAVAAQMRETATLIENAMFRKAAENTSVSYTRIGDALGTTHQAVQQRAARRGLRRPQAE